MHPVSSRPASVSLDGGSWISSWRCWLATAGLPLSRGTSGSGRLLERALEIRPCRFEATGGRHIFCRCRRCLTANPSVRVPCLPVPRRYGDAPVHCPNLIAWQRGGGGWTGQPLEQSRPAKATPQRLHLPRVPTVGPGRTCTVCVDKPQHLAVSIQQ